MLWLSVGLLYNKYTLTFPQSRRAGHLSLSSILRSVMTKQKFLSIIM